MTSTVQFRTPSRLRAACVTLLRMPPGAVQLGCAVQSPWKGESMMS
ncbi:hypothetical protein [Streptomyces sp. MZ04]|nr:hypothetical protein [Streptomyces sp. MZ04]